MKIYSNICSSSSPLLPNHHFLLSLMILNTSAHIRPSRDGLLVAKYNGTRAAPGHLIGCKHLKRKIHLERNLVFSRKNGVSKKKEGRRDARKFLIWAHNLATCMRCTANRIEIVCHFSLALK